MSGPKHKQNTKPPRPKSKAPGGKGSGKPKRDMSTGEKVFRVIWLVLTILSAVVVVLYLAFRFMTKPPSVEQRDPMQTGNVSAHDRAPTVTTTVDENGNVIEVVVPALPADRKSEFYTFLVVGQSQQTGGDLTDTMMLAAYDVPNQKLSIMSLPRDMYVSYGGRVRLLNSVYTMSRGGGIDGLKQAVKELTGVYPDFHIIVRWEAVGELVDAIGGVDYDVPFNMYYNDLSQHFKINLKKGRQHLNGQQAMGLIRWRHNSDDNGNISSTYGYAEGDLGRIKTQQSFLKEVIKKCLKMDVLLTNLPSYINIFQKNVTTNLEATDLGYFVKSALGGLDMENVTFCTLPWGNAYDSHLIPVGSEIVKTVNGGFNPYKVDISRGELKLVSLDDVPRVISTPEPSETPDPDATEDPDATPGPNASRRPGSLDGGDDEGEDEPLLPPGTIVRPSGSPRPSQSAKPGETLRPGQTAKPGETQKPGQTAKPGETAKPNQSARPGSLDSNDEPTATAKPKETPKGEENKPGGSNGEPPAAPATRAPAAPGQMDEEEPVLPPM